MMHPFQDLKRKGKSLLQCPELALIERSSETCSPSSQRRRQSSFMPTFIIVVKESVGHGGQISISLDNGTTLLMDFLKMEKEKSGCLDR